MKARIFKPCQNQMQSGKKNNKYWVLEYITQHPVKHDEIMGWSSSDDTQKQIKLKFENQDDAINFAILNKIDYELVDSNKQKIHIKSYADNFK
jgi:hypothetical protein